MGRTVVVGVTCLAALAFARVVRAAGYDSDVVWSGRYAGSADAAVATVEGAQSLYFNPAGLSLSKGVDIDLEFSPTFSRFSGPVTRSTSTVSHDFLPAYSGIISERLSSRFAIAAGVFFVGGANENVGKVDFSPINSGFASFHPVLNTSFTLFEGSIGVGYEPIRGLRLGFAWRVTFAVADVYAAYPLSGGTPSLAAVSMTSLADSPISGFRVGAQYTYPSGFFGFGVNWRTPVSFNADGNLSQQLVQPGSPTTSSTGMVTYASTLPSQIDVGGFIAPWHGQLRIALQYDFTNDSANTTAMYEGTLTTPGGTQPIPPLALQWHDEHTFRIGAELTLATVWAVRAGYVISTQVTPSAYVQVGLAPPGPTNTVTCGLGRSFRNGRVRVDLAGQYSTASGNGVGPYGIAGHFTEDDFVAHVGGSWSF